MQHITTRRNFLKTAGIAGALGLSGLSGLAFTRASSRRLLILHTNDTHSRIDPFPANDPNYALMGGYARRAALVNALRQDDPELLLLDAGDIFQGTPYFNMFGGELELKLMSKMGYDAATVGNHEFDNGLEGFYRVLPFARFPFVSSNYDFSDTILKGEVQKYLTLRRNGIRIGIYGLGIDPAGLVAMAQRGNTIFLDPLQTALEMEEMLKEKHRCELIICISHLGFRYRNERVSDIHIAQGTRHTDIIVGGHTHTPLQEPEVVINQNGKPVHIGQAGSGGVRLGVMEVIISENAEEKQLQGYTTKVFKSQVA